MNLSDEFWKRSEEVDSNNMESGRLAVGVDLDRRMVVLWTGAEMVDIEPDMARALTVGLTMAVDALRGWVAETN